MKRHHWVTVPLLHLHNVNGLTEMTVSKKCKYCGRWKYSEKFVIGMWGKNYLTALQYCYGRP